MSLESAHEIVWVDIDSIKLNKENTNKHPKEQIERLAKIIEYQGWRNPLIVWEEKGILAAGEGRYLAAKKLKLKQVPVSFQSFDSEDQFRAFVTSDNAIAAWAELDLSLINTQLAEFGPEFDIDLLGIENFEIDVADKYEDKDGDAVPENVETRCKPGDLWLLGEHRLLCGDSTNIQHVELLMNGVIPDIIYTDPPYGMNAVSKSGVLSKNYKKDIIGDDNTDAAKDAFRLIYGMWPDSKHVWWGANYYSSVLPDSECWMVWDKNNGESDQTDCELAWANFRSVVRMFTQSSEKINRVHPTQKPVSLIEWVFRRFKYKGNTMFDAFGGSGSTLIACEKTNRKCFMMELDPHYCDVILKRWEDFTGKEATLCQADQESK
jgi:16S rRNA G966 N2-methylase RsmD